MLEWVQYAQAPPLDITWVRSAGPADPLRTIPEDLTGATITGTVQRRGVVEALTGTLAVVDGPAGVFRWTPSAADVAEAGQFTLQFEAAFATGPTPAKTKRIGWRVYPSQVVTP